MVLVFANHAWSRGSHWPDLEPRRSGETILGMRDSIVKIEPALPTKITHTHTHIYIYMLFIYNHKYVHIDICIHIFSKSTRLSDSTSKIEQGKGQNLTELY